MSLYDKQVKDWQAYAHQSISMMLEADANWSEEESEHWANEVAECIVSMRRGEELSYASTMVHGYTVV